MATSEANLIETHRKGAETYHGDGCVEKAIQLLEEFLFPAGILPVEDIVEIGINRSTGFVWAKLNKKKVQVKFNQIKQSVIYSEEITGFIEPAHMWNVTGVKAKEMMIPVVICDILVGFPSPDMLRFTTPIGLSRAYLTSVFMLQSSSGPNEAHQAT